MEQSLSLIQAWQIVRKHLVAILLWTVIFGVGAWTVATFLMSPKYSANTQILVNRKSSSNVSASDNGVQFQDQQADIQMITTYKDIITNQVVLDEVSQELAHPKRVVVQEATKPKYELLANGERVQVRAGKPAITKPASGKRYTVTSAQLKRAIKISNQQNSQVFAITVTTGNAEKAAKIANVTASVFKSQIKKIMSVNNVTVVSRATASDQKVFPRPVLMVALGLLLGLIIGLAYAFIREITDTTVKDETLLSESLGLTNLGHITRISGANSISATKISSGNKHVDEPETRNAKNPKHLSNRV